MSTAIQRIKPVTTAEKISYLSQCIAFIEANPAAPVLIKRLDTGEICGRDETLVVLREALAMARMEMH